MAYFCVCWDVKSYPLTITCAAVTVSALKRKTMPRNGLVYYLAISHRHDQHGWRLRPVPSNYELRYVCKKGSPASRCSVF